MCELDPCGCAVKAKRDDQQIVSAGGLRLDKNTYLDGTLSGLLRLHQVLGIRFLYVKVIKGEEGCVLADHMGLGKTLQVIGTLQCWSAARLATDQTRTALVVAPAIVVPNWLDEANKWLPRNRGFRMGALPSGDARRLAAVKDWRAHGGCLVVGYEMFLRIVSKETEMSQLLLGTGLIVLDEAHRIKDPKSKIHLALRRVTTKRRILVTGYPIQNRLDEYYALVDYARPNILGDDDLFKRFFEGPIASYVDRTEAQSDDVDPAEVLRKTHVLRAVLQDVVLRRGADTLGDDLPLRHDWVVECDLTGIQRKLYDAFVASGDAESGNSEKGVAAYHTALAICNHPDIIKTRLAEEERLFSGECSEEVVPDNAWAAPEVVAREAARAAARQLNDQSKREQLRVKARMKNGVDDDEAFCGSLRKWAGPVLDDYVVGGSGASCKARVCLALLEKIKSRGERCVVFTQTLGTLDVLENLLRRTDISCNRIDGSMSTLTRSDIVHDFNAGNNAVDALLVSIKAGGEGVNMTGASRVILYDVSWNPCFDRQAMCRAHRLGQKREVNVYRLVAPSGTLEARAFELQRRKELLVREVIQQQGVSTEMARLIEGRCDDVLAAVVEAHTKAIISVKEDRLETAPPAPVSFRLSELEKKRALDEWAAMRRI